MVPDGNAGQLGHKTSRDIILKLHAESGSEGACRNWLRGWVAKSSFLAETQLWHMIFRRSISRRLQKLSRLVKDAV